MSSFEFNKIAGAVLATALMVFGLKSLAGVIYNSERPEKPGYVIEVAETATQADGTDAGTAQSAESLGKLLAAADPKKGETVAKPCAGCHDFSKGGPNKVGPNLWGIVGRLRAGHEGFAYSEAMASKKGDPWNYEKLFAFLKKPSEYVPGTKMSFGGIAKDKDRADLLAYLATLADTKVPFPNP
ncbi:MAG: cytochrome c family protein [Rhizobiales bacterium]|nr:cytochrome c family protein [Hyphomicrobiales bacterium]MBI3671917.1 cytochrome c family protein [Hyphomicrobiales bacterium]